MASDIVLTMDGMLLNWLKDVGDSVNAGEVIAEVEADKATVELEAPANGVILSLDAEIGEELPEGSVIGKIGEQGESADSKPAQAPEAEEKSAPETSSTPSQATASSNGKASTTPDGRIKISPVARKIAEDKGYDISQISGSGPGGRIVKSDVENFTPSAAPAPQAQPQQKAVTGIAAYTPPPLPQGDHVEIIDVTKMRSRIAENTVQSKQQVPHFYVTSDMNLEPLLALRKQLNASLESRGVKVSVNDLIVKAAAIALLEFPNLNTHYYGDKLVRHKNINIGIAVALPNGGLINVVAKNADSVAIGTLAETNKEMIARARDGKVKPDDIKNSTFTVSNLGPFDVDHFIAIINPPEAGILAVGSGKRVPFVADDGSITAQTRIKITISVDHRVSDGAEGAAYLQHLKSLIENPMVLLA